MRTMSAALLAAAFFFTAANDAPAAQKPHTIGFLAEDSLVPADVAALQKMLQERGYVDANAITVQTRFAGGRVERLDDLARELFQGNVELLVARGLSAGQAARRQNRKLPIVIASRTEPFRPAGNVTGATNLSVDLTAARLRLLKELLPKVARMTVLWHENSPIASSYPKKIKQTAHSLGVEIESRKLRRSGEFEAVFQALAAEHGQGILVEPQELFEPHLAEIASLGLKGRLPVLSGVEEFAAAGGLGSYGLSVEQMWRHTALLIDKILRHPRLKNGQPAELPTEQPAKFELVINLKTAGQLGIAVPKETLARADKVIK